VTLGLLFYFLTVTVVVVGPARALVARPAKPAVNAMVMSNRANCRFTVLSSAEVTAPMADNSPTRHYASVMPETKRHEINN
jgi:hypothetical protein